MSPESDVTLLTSGEASDPSTLGYDGKPSQENRRYWNFLLDFTTNKDSPSLRRNSTSLKPAISSSRRTFELACVSDVAVHCFSSSPKYEKKRASCSDWTPSLSHTRPLVRLRRIRRRQEQRIQSLEPALCRSRPAEAAASRGRPSCRACLLRSRRTLFPASSALVLGCWDCCVYCGASVDRSTFVFESHS